MVLAPYTCERWVGRPDNRKPTGNRLPERSDEHRKREAS
jgi:hypothetical protein